MEKLIRDYLEGTLDGRKLKVLTDWIREDKANEDKFREYCAGWNPADNANSSKSWNRLLEKRRKQDSGISSNGTRLRLIGRQMLRYAAVLVIGMALALGTRAFLNSLYPAGATSDWIHVETGLGQKTKLVLPDSSSVWLNSDSRLSFSCDFEKQRKRIVHLEGEAFFDVAKQGRNRLIVQCEDYNVEVKGTKFNIMAYRDFDRTETTLVEGSVMIQKGTQHLQLNPGERAVASGAYLTRSRAKIRQATLWKENKFYFDNVAFTELARRLERWYNVEITLADRSLDDIYYSGYFKNEETVWQVLDVISLTTPITYEKKDFREITIFQTSN